MASSLRFLAALALCAAGTRAAARPDVFVFLTDQQRADAIKAALATTFAVAPNRLFTVGVGEEQPIDPAHPDAAINRRVQVINIGVVK